MARNGAVYKELVRYQKQMESLKAELVEQFIQEVARELAARLLAKVIPRTPVGRYPKEAGKKGGTLRRGWTAETQAQAEAGGSSDAAAYAGSMEIVKVGSLYQISIANPVYYAPYVEFGHRTPKGNGWVQGCFMLTISEDELLNEMPGIIQRRFERFLKEAFRG